MKYGILFLLLLIMTTAAIIVGSYGHFQKNTNQQLQSPKARTTITPTPIPKSSSAVYINPYASQTAIKQSLTTAKYQNLSEFLAENVSITISENNCCGILTKENAIIKLNYLKQATAPWTYDPNEREIKQFLTTHHEYATNSLIARSANNSIVAFGFSSSHLIEKIYITK